MNAIPQLLVLDTSVVVKWYLLEEQSDEAILLLDAVEGSFAEFIAPSSLPSEFFNTLWQRHRRRDIDTTELNGLWRDFRSGTAITLYDPSDLVDRAAELTSSTRVLIYDTLFLALAEATDSVMVTADNRLLKSLERTDYTHLAVSLTDVAKLVR